VRKAKVFLHNKQARILTVDENGYHFQYSKEYLESDNPKAISLLFPLQYSGKKLTTGI